MKRSILVMMAVVAAIVSGCGTEPEFYSPDVWEMELIPNLEQLNDEYYVLELDTLKLQTVHVLDGKLTLNDSYPNQRNKITWSSSHQWFVGDTLGYIVRRTINDQGQWSTLDTIIVSLPFKDPVPTVNAASISKPNGSFRQTMAPILPMKNDTLIIRTVAHVDPKEPVRSVIKIILQ